MDEEFFDRTKTVFNKDFDKIKNCNIALIGVGGVGGYIFEMLVRLGVENITVVDCDVFEKSNLNRQILSTLDVIKKPKVEVAKNRASLINLNCNVKPICAKVNKLNVQEILNEKYDYVIDAIDDVSGKIAIIKFCSSRNIPIVCCMGTGNRSGIPNFVVEDLFKTSYDGLCRKMRNELKKDNFSKKIDVVYTKEQAVKTDKLGSVVYYPLMCAGTVTSYVVNKIISSSK